VIGVTEQVVRRRSPSRQRRRAAMARAISCSKARWRAWGLSAPGAMRADRLPRFFTAYRRIRTSLSEKRARFGIAAPDVGGGQNAGGDGPLPPPAQRGPECGPAFWPAGELWGAAAPENGLSHHWQAVEVPFVMRAASPAPARSSATPSHYADKRLGKWLSANPGKGFRWPSDHSRWRSPRRGTVPASTPAGRAMGIERWIWWVWWVSPTLP
jgi:hypothetical protein